MPFVSEKQRKYLWMNKPEVAKEFSSKEKKDRNNRKDAINRKMKGY